LRIVINTAHQRFGGAVQVALSFIHECINFPENEYYVWVGPGVGKSLDTKIFPQNFKFFWFTFGEIGFKEIYRIQKVLRNHELEIRPAVIISTSGPSYYHSLAPQILGFNLPWYIYPESPFMRELPLKKKLKYWLRKKIHFFYFKKDAIAFLTQTNDVRDRVKIALKTDKVYTITNNHNHYFEKSLSIDKCILPKSINGDFKFLTLSSYYPHKNLELISDVSEILKIRGFNNIKFILTIEENDFLRYFKPNESIINIGPIKPSECPNLYNECNGLFLPTLAECFSASYPEAMVMKKPIITTDLGFAKSICGDAALYFKPKDAVDAADKIISLINSDLLQKKLVENGLLELIKFDTARERARKYLKICEAYSSK
jgi:glycosyltransferase involved in cell wall biosynthesis